MVAAAAAAEKGVPVAVTVEEVGMGVAGTAGTEEHKGVAAGTAGTEEHKGVAAAGTAGAA